MRKVFTSTICNGVKTEHRYKNPTENLRGLCSKNHNYKL